MKNLRSILTVFLFLSSVLAFAECPVVPSYYPRYTGPEGSSWSANPAYDDGSVPAYSIDANKNLTVWWPHNGTGHVIRYLDGLDGQNAFSIPVTITSSISFSSTPNGLCNSSTATISVADNCGTSFVWSAPAGWSINGGSNILTTSSSAVSITSPSTGSGNGLITVSSNTSGSINVYIPYGLVTIYPQVSAISTSSIAAYWAYASDPSTWYSFTSSMSVCAGTQYLFKGVYTFNYTGNSYTFNCQVGGPGGQIVSQSNIYAPTTVTLQTSTPYPIPYSSAILVNYSSTRNNVGGGGHNNIVASPNPASTLLKVSLIPEAQDLSNKDIATPAVRISLVNSSGRIVRPEVNLNETSNLNLEDVPDGIYYLNAIVDGVTTKTRIVIRH